MRLNFVREKRLRERGADLELGELIELMARDNPGFAAWVGDMIRNSSLSKKDKALVLEGLCGNKAPLSATERLRGMHLARKPRGRLSPK